MLLIVIQILLVIAVRNIKRTVWSTLIPMWGWVKEVQGSYTGRLGGVNIEIHVNSFFFPGFWIKVCWRVDWGMAEREAPLICCTYHLFHSHYKQYCNFLGIFFFIDKLNWMPLEKNLLNIIHQICQSFCTFSATFNIAKFVDLE